MRLLPPPGDDYLLIKGHGYLDLMQKIFSKDLIRHPMLSHPFLLNGSIWCIMLSRSTTEELWLRS